MNRGSKSAPEAADATNSWVLRQVSNGVAPRMARSTVSDRRLQRQFFYAGDES